MSENLSASLQKLKKASLRLNEISNKANESIRMVEEFLSNTCSIGISVSLDLEPENVNTFLPTQYLEYKKINNKYRLVVVEKNRVSTALRGSGSNIKPLSDCSRDLKLEAIKFLPKFLDEVTLQITKQIKLSGDAAESIHDAISAFTGQGV